jgi:putative glutamine amidotransferase
VDDSAPWAESETIGRASDVVGHFRSRPIGSGERAGGNQIKAPRGSVDPGLDSLPKGLPKTPLIGICTAVERAQYGAWDADVFLLQRTYVDAVQRAGGVAIMLPPDPAVDPDRLLDVIDGLILAGGRDVDPATYGAEPHPETDEPVTERDDFEIRLARRALERDIPLLGICRGMQLMNVARGGTLVQDLPEHVGHEDHRRSLGTFDGNDHPVHLTEGSLAVHAAGEVRHGTLSHHHQGIDRVGDGFTVTGWADDDELPEAMEDPALRFALGVQWHPEADPDSQVVAALVEAARAR